MSEHASKRRWFRFSLSTIFVLVTIAAWTMAIRPHIVVESSPWPIRDANGQTLWLGPVPDRHHPNRDLFYPALALATFVAWKGYRPISNCYRKSPATH